MILIPDRRLVILLPWKTASQTLRARLAPFNASPYDPFFHFNRHLCSVVHQHLTLGQFLALPEARQGHRIAVFVRNPYDRVYSGFRQIRRDLTAQPHARHAAPWIRSQVMSQLAVHRRLVDAAGEDVDKWFRSIPAHSLLSAGQDSSLPLHPCHYWTHSGGRKLAAFIGRVESFEADFARLCAEYDLPAARDVSANVSDDLVRQRDAGGYDHAARLAPETIGRINRLFLGDFQLFGYRAIDPAREISTG